MPSKYSYMINLESISTIRSQHTLKMSYFFTTILKRWDIFSYRIFFKLTQPSTIIERINRDVDGIEINPAIHSQMERLRIRDIRAQVAAKGGLSVHSTNLIY